MMKRFRPLPLALCVMAGLLVLMLLWRGETTPMPEKAEKAKNAAANVPAAILAKGDAKQRLASAASGRLKRPLTGLSDVKLPERIERLWASPVQETAFEEFRRWTETLTAADVDLEKGIELARQRRAELLDLIDQNPKRALELAVPMAVRRGLPAEVVALLEEPVSARGDLLVQATTSDAGSCTITRTATLRDRRVFDAYTYGRRGAMPTRDGIGIHGVALDGKLAMADLPGRVLEKAEIAARVAAGLPMENGFPQSDGGADVVVAWDDQRVTRYEDEAQAIAALIYEEAEEQFAEPAPTSDLDGVIAASPWTEGQKTLLIIRVDFPDYQGQVVSDATLQQLIADMNTVYTDMSSGKASYALLGQGSAITPTVRMPNSSSTYASHTKLARVLTDARAAANAVGFNYLNYTHEIVVTGATPLLPYTSGMANVGARGSWVHNSQWNLKTCAHEIGHNFGLPHAGAWDTDDGSVIGPGSIWDYGNVFDLMGVGSSSAFLRHFGATFKEYLDWMPMTDVVKVTTDGSTTTRIRAMDKVQADGNRRALAVDRAGSTDDYWVEYRQLYGTSFGMRDGVLVNWADINGGYQQPLLLDMVPTTFQKDDAVLPMGKTFSDTAAGIHITPVARGTDGDGVTWMDVTVNRGTFAGNVKPTVSLGSTNANPAINVSVTFTATASDPNGDTLAYFWEWGDGTTTANNSPIASKSWSTAGTKTVRCIVTDMKGQTTTAWLLVQVGGSSGFSIQGTVSTTLGAPMQGVVVSASPTQSATTDGDGAYSITGLAAGSYTLTATKTGASFVTSGFTNPVTVGPSQTGKNFLAPPGAPTFTATMKNGLTDQGSSTGAIPLPLADADTAISALTLSASSSNQSIIPDASVTFSTGTNRTITASAGSTVSGSVDITITATDPEGNTGTYVWPVTVNAKPVLATTTPTTSENTPVDIDLRAFVSDDITPDERIFFEVDRVRNGKMTLLPDGYTARFTPNPNFNGTTNYRLVVRDQSLGAGFRFFYDFEPPDVHEDALSTDQSNYNRTGTLQSINGGTYAYDAGVPPALSPQSSNALVLAQNGSSGARLRRTLTTADHNLNDADWTLSAWVKRGGTDTEDFVFHLGDGDGHGTENELELFFAAGSDVLKLQKWGAGGLEKEIVCSGIPAGEWHHLTLSYDRTATNTGDFYLYVGKFLRGSVTGVTMNVNQAAPVVVGGHGSTTANVDRWFDGVMDEVLFQSGLSTRNEIFNRSRMGARHHHGLSVIGNNLAITVTGSNQPPSIVAVPDRYIPVNATASPVTVRLVDADTEGRSLTLTASSSNQALLPNANITVGAAPPAWTNGDIGTVTTAGSLTESRGTFVVNGAGTGIGPATGDSFRWVRQSFTGDAEMIARVVSLDHTASNAEANLMMRESTAATARFVSVRVTGSEGVSFVQRGTAATDAVVTATLPLASAPCWLRLVRTGSIYTAFYATDNDGIAGAWQAVGTEQTVAFTGTTHDIGMAVSSRVDTTLSAAVFDNLGGTVLRGGERTVSLTPAAGQSGSSTITLTANDGSLTGSTIFNVIVDGAAPSTTVWNATTSGTLNWSTGSNWTGGVTPPSSRFSTVAFFTGQTLAAGSITSNNDSVGGHALNVLTLGGTGPTSGTTTMTLGGNALLMRRESLLDPVVNLSATNGTGLTWDVSAPVTMEDSTTFTGAGTATFLFSGVISGNAGLIKSGSSKLTLTGANTYAGTTTINAGILQIGNDGAAGSLPSGEIVNNSTLRFDRTGTLLVPNLISGSGGITIDCPINNGTVVLSGNNSFTGAVTVASGALRITNSNALGTTFSAKDVLLTNGTAGNPQLRLDGSSGSMDLPAAINYRVSNPAGAIFNEAGDNILRGNITLTSGGTGESRVVVNAGSLRLAGTIQNETASNTRTFVLGGAAGVGQVEGIISNGSATGSVIALRKIENGTWTLTGTNTYTGATTLNAGTLRINAPGSLHASSAVTINAATLAGDGSIGGSVTVNASGRIAPGATTGSAGTLAIGGGLTITAMTTGTGKLVFELGALTASDQITVGGTFTVGSGTLGIDDFTFIALSGLTAGTYKLITATTLSGTLDPAKLTGTLGAFNTTLSITGNDLELVLVSPFTTWQTNNSPSGTFNGDHDNDGVPNGIEYFLGGTSNTTGQTPLPAVQNNSGTLSITWTKAPGHLGTYGTDFVIESSDTLTGVWTTETLGVNVTVNGNNFTYTFPASTRRFARLKVMGP